MTTTRRNRIWRHAISDDADVRRTYPIDALERIEQLIEDGEATHTGEVCVAIEPALPVGRVWRRVPPLERALEVFGLLRVWDTEDNNGVLIYLLLADRRFEIVADRGIHRHVGNEGWAAIARQMETDLRRAALPRRRRARREGHHGAARAALPGRRPRPQSAAQPAGAADLTDAPAVVLATASPRWSSSPRTRGPSVSDDGLQWGQCGFSMPIRCSESPCDWLWRCRSTTMNIDTLTKMPKIRITVRMDRSAQIMPA